MKITKKKIITMVSAVLLILSMLFTVSLSAGAETNDNWFDKTVIDDSNPFDNVTNRLILEIDNANNAIAPGNNFTYETQQAVATAIQNAQALLDNPNATDEQMLLAIDELKKAVDNLKVPEIDTAYLWSLIEKADYAFDREIRYTEESYQAFSAALTTARVNYHYGQTQSEVDKAANDLDLAINNLVPKYSDIIIGDVDDDKVVSITDATHIQRQLARLEDFSEKQEISADYNDDTNIAILDVTLIQRMLAKLDS